MILCKIISSGDGNIHFNVTARDFSHKMLGIIEPYVYEWSARYNGSISAEHGIGLKKRKFLHFSKSAAAIRLMKDIKEMMDPKGILNPYKVLP
jgi:FAD/FMN-containing dehydrogenase